MVKDGVQSLLGIPVHHTVVFDSSNLDETDIVNTPRAGKRCAAAGVVRSLRPEGLVRRIPSLVGALGISVTSDIPLDLVPDMVDLLPTLSPRQVLTVPITAPDYGRAEQKSQVADPERVGSHGEPGEVVPGGSRLSARTRRPGPLRHRPATPGGRRQPVIDTGRSTIGRP